MTELTKKIIELRNLGYSYNKIALELNCSKGTIAYHLSPGQKEKNKERAKKLHPYHKKLLYFLKRTKIKSNRLNFSTSNLKLLQHKIIQFCKQSSYYKSMFTIEDVINKFGENPKCYITGQDINIYEPRTYHFDHIIPVSKGGQNTLDNLGICTRRANFSKSDMNYEEFVEFCKQVIDYYNYKKTT